MCGIDGDAITHDDRMELDEQHQIAECRILASPENGERRSALGNVFDRVRGPVGITLPEQRADPDLAGIRRPRDQGFPVLIRTSAWRPWCRSKPLSTSRLRLCPSRFQD